MIATMKLLIIWLSLSLFVSDVLGNVLAGPYQTMLFWFAYRMDVATFGSGATLIAPGCEGHVPDGSCYFDEFLRYIQRTGQTTNAWTGSTTVGENLSPDVLETANELSTSGTGDARYSNTLEPSQLLPNKYVAGQSPSFTAIFTDVVDNIQACRAHVNDLGLDDEVEGVRRSMVSLQDARQADQAAKVIAGVNGQLSSAGHTWEVELKDNVAPDLSTWTSVDTEKTLSEHSTESDDLKNAITSYVANFDTLSDDNRRHALAIQASQALESRLLGDPSC